MHMLEEQPSETQQTLHISKLDSTIQFSSKQQTTENDHESTY